MSRFSGLARNVGISWLLTLLILFSPGSAEGQTVTGTITVDNGYGFGFGDVNGITTYFNGVDNCSAGASTNCGCPGPESYTIPSISLNDYFYIVAWSDEAVLQGAIAEFTDGTTTITTTPGIP